MNTMHRYPRLRNFGLALLLGGLGAMPVSGQRPVLIIQDGSGGESRAKDPAFVADNFASGRMIKNLPFDGLNIVTHESSWCMANDSVNNFSSTTMAAAFDPLRSVNFTASTFKHNYVILRIRRPGVSGTAGDFFDDNGWNATLAEVQTLAQVVSEVLDSQGNRIFKGIMFDNEDYSNAPYHAIWDWNDSGSYAYKSTKTLQQYLVQARLRFKQLYGAIQAGYPGCSVSTPGAEKWGTWVWYDAGSASNRPSRELAATSAIGMFEGKLDSGGTLVDWGDQYRVTTWNQAPTGTNIYTPEGYDRQYRLDLFSFPLGNDPAAPVSPIYETALLPTALAPSYPLSVLKSWGVSDDMRDEQNNSTPKTAAQIQEHLTFALRRADTEVTFYTQTYDWFGTTYIDQPLVTQAIIDAVTAARASAATRDRGTVWYSTGFASASDWTPTGGTWSLIGGAYQKDDFTTNHSRVNGTEFPNNPSAGEKLTWTDYEVTGKVKIVAESAANAGKAGILGRYQNPSNYYSFRLVTNGTTKQWELAKIANGTTTVLDNGSYAWSVGNTYTLKMVFDSRSILCWISSDGGVNWTPAASSNSDYSFLSGKVGVTGEAAKASFDDITVTYQAKQLVGHWKLDAGSGTSAVDSSGYGSNGTLIGSPSPAWVTGQVGSFALSFNGGGGVSDPAVDCGNPPSLINLPAISAAAWINPNSMGEGGKGRVIDKTDGNVRWALYVTGTNQIAFLVRHDTTNLERITNSVSGLIGAWKHVAVTWDGTANATGVKIYVNGVESTYATSIDGVGRRSDDSNGVVTIGNDGVGNRTFDGSLDDVRLYSGVLTLSEIQGLAGGGAPVAPAGLTATPIAYNQINLSWSDVTNETGYKIERKKGSSGTYAQIATTGVGIVTYNDTSVGAGTTYYYRVRAYNGAGDSAYSAEANATSTEITSGRVGHWKLDEGTGTTTADSSGNGNTGTLGSSPATPVWLMGAKIGNGLVFDGADDVVNCGSGATLDNLSALTVSAWINADSMGEGGLGCIVDKSVATGGSRWRLRTEGTNQVGFLVKYTTTNLARASAINAIATGSWYHVLATWTGSATATNVKLYVNGAEVTYGTTTNGVGTREDDAATNLSLGNEAFGARAFDGSIDDVRVYNRVLSAAEITAIYRAGL